MLATIFLSGRKSEEIHEAVVGFATKTGLVGKLSGIPKGINYHLMRLTRPLSCNKNVTIIITNALTMTSPGEVMISSATVWKLLFLQKQAHPGVV